MDAVCVMTFAKYSPRIDIERPRKIMKTSRIELFPKFE
jgi:hypothetical protein